MSERTYNDSCGLARGLDVIGDRWALLIVRELLLGPKRFVDLRSGLPKISQNVLSQRLDDLEQAGVLERILLDPPANTAAYELTERGHRLRPALVELARWGAFVPSPPGSEQGAAAFMLTLDVLFDPSRVHEITTGTITIGRERFTVQVGPAGFVARRGDDSSADFHIVGTIPALRAAFVGVGDPNRHEADGELQITGDREAFERFRSCFPSPMSGSPRSDSPAVETSS
jgi:DNA-binding HxlR family transcriptional regulator